jgi:hypothetical protein
MPSTVNPKLQPLNRIHDFSLLQLRRHEVPSGGHHVKLGRVDHVGDDVARVAKSRTPVAAFALHLGLVESLAAWHSVG